MNVLSLAGPFRYYGDRKEGSGHIGFGSWLGRRGHEVCLLSCAQCRGCLGKVTFHPPLYSDRLHDSKPWASSAYIYI